MKVNSYHIAILGAGISGLATAWFIKQFLGNEIRLIVIEKNQRAGGWIQTLQTDQFLFEQGPRSCRTKGFGQETLALIEALGLREQVIVSHSDAQNRYLYNGKHLQRFPKHLWEIPFNPLTQGWLRAFWRDWRAPKRQKEDESIQAFFSRRLGASWTENLINPFVLGIYAGDYNRLSLKSCFPLFDQWEQKHSSLLLGSLRHRSSFVNLSHFIQKICRFPLFSFQEGMETLPRTLAAKLKENLCLGKAVTSLNFDKQFIKIQLDDGSQLLANQVISTLPTFSLNSVLTSYPYLATNLSKLPYATVIILNVGFHQSVLPLKGFGYLVPSKLGLQVLGCVWDSCIFPQHNKKYQTRLTIMLGGMHHLEVEQMSESDLIEQGLRVLREHLDIRMEPQFVQIKRARNAIPQFEVGHHLWKKEIQKTIDRLFPSLILSGSAWTGVSINDCIVQARYLAEEISIAHKKISNRL